MRTVLEAMITEVKRTSVTSTVADLRSLFADEHVHSAVVVDGDVLTTVVDRSDLRRWHADDAPAAALGTRSQRTVAPGVDVHVAWRLLVDSGRRRLAVVEPDGTFLGLLCLKRSREGFCSDDDVAARTGHTASVPSW